MLEDARRELGMPVAVTPLGFFGKEIPHGTNAGYQMHRYRGVPTCAACREARRKYDRDRRGGAAANG